MIGRCLQISSSLQQSKINNLSRHSAAATDHQSSISSSLPIQDSKFKIRRLAVCRTWEVNELRIANSATIVCSSIEELRLTPLYRPLIENRPVREPKSDRLLAAKPSPSATQSFAINGAWSFTPSKAPGCPGPAICLAMVSGAAKNNCGKSAGKPHSNAFVPPTPASPKARCVAFVIRIWRGKPLKGPCSKTSASNKESRHSCPISP